MSKKAISLLACNLFCWLAMSGQMISGGNESRKSAYIAPSHNVSIGLRGGMNISQWGLKWNVDPIFNDLAFSPGVGWRAGVSIDIKLWRNLFLETGVYYSEKTTKFELGRVEATDMSGSALDVCYPYYVFRPAYIEMPVLFSAQFKTSHLV